jgi:hypothetical protein
VVYSRKIDDKVFTFGISGRLYKSNVLLYDHQSESLWSQLMEKAIAGPMVGTQLKKVVSVRVKWRTWRKKQQNTLVLSDNTGFARDYATDPYEGYYRLGSLMFPVGDVRKDLPTKERVLGLTVQGGAKAYAITRITRQPGIIEDKIGDTVISIHISKDGEITNVTDDRGESIPHIFSYWFAWQAFHPDTAVYKRD